MASLLTNATALSALQTLSQTQKDLATTQNRISSGLRVAEAADNAVYWSIATTMKSDNTAMSAVKDSLNLGASTLDVATAALNSSIGVLNQLKTDLVAAAQPGADRAKIQLDITQLQKQLKSIADSASFNGQNWLSQDSTSANYNATKGIVASFSRDSSGGVTVGTIDIDTAKVKLYDATNTTPATTAAVSAAATTYEADPTVAGSKTALDTAIAALSAGTLKTKLTTTLASYHAAANAGTPNAATVAWAKAAFDDAVKALVGSNKGILDTVDTTTSVSLATLDISALTDSSTDVTTLQNMTKQVDNALKSITNAASTLGATKTRITLQATFVSALQESITKGVGSLVDADMNEESTRLQALQVQQQLGVQSLGIANQNSMLILKLFGG